MTSNKKERRWSRIPIRFADREADDEARSDETPDTSDKPAATADEFISADPLNPNDSQSRELPDLNLPPTREQAFRGEEDTSDLAGGENAGPVFAELLATRAELKRVQAEANELRDSVTRRQADFENFRKRVERERSETYNRSVADLVGKLLPVLDNLGRALDAEASVEASESDEFRHFLSGVDLIYKQLSGVLETLGVKPVPAEGEPFDPYVHEAVVTEETDDYEPDTVMQEIVRGYRLGDKLLRPALVKVAVKK